MRFKQDFTFALRTACHKPAFTVVLLAALTLGIGLTTAIFSVFYTVLLKPLPFNNPARLALVMEKLPQIPVPINMPPAEALELATNPAFSETALFISSTQNLQGGDHPERIDVLRASASLLPLLGIAPFRGRAFTEQEENAAAHIALISESLQRRRFGEEEALGKTILLDGMPYEIVGILPGDLTFPIPGMSQSPANADVWTPLSLTASERSPQNSDYSYSLIARLRPGFTPAQAQAAGRNAVEQILKQLPPGPHGKIQLEAEVLPLKEQVVAGSRRLLWLLLATVAALLLISCMNVSNMLLNRALTRRRELALRVSLGADSKAIILQLLNETLVLFLIGGALGVLCAIWSEQALVRLLSPNLPRLTDAHIHGTVLGFALAVSLVTGLVFGLIPAIGALRSDLTHGLSAASRSYSAGRDIGATRRVLVIGQISLAFVLLTSAGLLLRSFSAVLEQQESLRTDRVLSFGVALPEEQYPTVSDGLAFYRELSRRFGMLPGVLSMGLGTDIPLENKSGRLISPEHPTVINGNPIVYNTDVEGDYFHTLGLRTIAGRLLSAHDNQDSERVAVVNRSFGKAFWSSSDLLGRRFKFGPQNAPGPWVRIVGVIADSAARTPDQPSEPRIYLPLEQDPYVARAMREAWFVLRTEGDALTLTHSVQNVVRSLDPAMPLVKPRSMEQVVAGAVAPRSANTWLVTVFSVAALLLSSLGIYGVIAQSVAERTREIGTRMALGANRADISRMVLWQGGRLVLAGFAVGIPASFGASQLIRTLLYGVSADDSITRLIIIAVITSTVMVALLLPLWRAIHVDPQAALREI
ncbi:MAG TPA: ABC transporter permease [Bryobacteraceae bacterium]|nr:ABC transporter permease [Bryobacteraceae bacterium]